MDLFLEQVHKDFTEKKVISFLTSKDWANVYLDTSKAYCFTLFKFLEGSSFDYFYNQHSQHNKTIFNSAILWSKMETMLKTNVSEIAVLDATWNEAYQLKYNKAESFDMFLVICYYWKQTETIKIHCHYW